MTPTNQTTPTAKAVTLAGGLLAGTARYRREGNVVADLFLLLSELGIDHLDIEREYTIGQDRIDIYLPRYRTIIEAKAKGGAAHPNERRSGASESPVEQLERYVLAEIASERRRLPFPGELPSNREWTGIIADGQHWHIYAYPHVNTPREQRRILHSGRVQQGAEALIQLLSDRISDEPVGRTWIPSDPAHLFPGQGRNTGLSVRGNTPSNSPGHRNEARPVARHATRLRNIAPGPSRPQPLIRYAFVPDRDCPHGDALAEAPDGRLETPH